MQLTSRNINLTFFMWWLMTKISDLMKRYFWLLVKLQSQFCDEQQVKNSFRRIKASKCVPFQIMGIYIISDFQCELFLQTVKLYRCFLPSLLTLTDMKCQCSVVLAAEICFFKVFLVVGAARNLPWNVNYRLLYQ
jgi:hypothetical protein